MNRKILLAGMAALIFTAASVAGLLTYFNSGAGRTVIAEIGGEKVYLGEFYYYLTEPVSKFEDVGGEDIWEMDFGGGESADNLAKQNSLDTIAIVKTSVKQAQKQGVLLDDAETEASDERARQVFDEMGEEYAQKLGIDLAGLTETMRQIQLYLKLWDKITENYAISNWDFDRYFDIYCVENQKLIKTVTIQYILCVKGERAAENAAMIKALAFQGLALDEVLPRLPQDFPGIENIKYGRAMANEGLIHKEAVDVAYELPVGVVSDVIPTGDGGYYVLEVLDIKLSDMEALKAEVRETYITEKKTEMFDREYARWAEGVEVIKNQNVWNDISVFDLF